MGKHIAEQFNLPLASPSKAYQRKYPNAPGYKNKDPHGPSKEAAIAMLPKAPTLRQLCLERIEQLPMTADEVADLLEKPIYSIRPRITELLKLGKIVDSGQRRANESGKTATVWRVAA